MLKVFLMHDIAVINQQIPRVDPVGHAVDGEYAAPLADQHQFDRVGVRVKRPHTVVITGLYTVQVRQFRPAAVFQPGKQVAPRKVLFQRILFHGNASPRHSDKN